MLYFIISLIFIALVSLFKTRWGLYLILVLLPTYLLRTQIFGIPTTFLELSIYVVFGVWFLKAIFTRDLIKKTKRLLDLAQPFLIPLVLFFSAAIISTIISPDKRLSLGVLKGWFFDPFLVLILLLDLVRTKKQIKRMVIALFLCASWVSAYGLWEYILGKGLDRDGRLNSVFIPANYVAMFITPILVSSFSFIKKIKSKILLVTGYWLLVTNILALYLTKSYGGWLGLLAAFVFLWTQVRVPNKRLKYLLIFALLVISVSVFQARSVKFGQLFELDYRTSSATRSEIWQTSLLIARDHPLLGIGLGNFERVYREYVPQVTFPPLEWLVVKPHNLYLNLWLEMGLLGLVAFVWLIIIFFKKGFGYRNNCLVKYSLATMIALLVHGLVDTPYFKNDLSVLFWVLIGLIMIMQNVKIKNQSDKLKCEKL